MATITVSNLCPSGAELFMDVESFMHDLNEEEMIATNGGLTPLGVVVIMGVKVSTGWFLAGAALGAGAAVAEAL